LIYYLDTSALVKAYVEEDRSDDVEDLIEETRDPGTTTRVFASRLAYPETASAIARRQREGGLTRQEAQLLYGAVTDDFTGPARPYEIVEATAAVIDEAATLVQRYPLRGFDAVHLATALLLHQAAPGAVTLAAADRRLLDVATAEGLLLLDLR
jgi:uncharacterized protein